MTLRNLHVVHLLIRENLPDGRVGFLVYPHEHWRDGEGKSLLALPAKKTVADPLAAFIQGTPLDGYIEQIVGDELGIPMKAFALEEELEAIDAELGSPLHGTPTHYTVYPIDVWIHPDRREPLRSHTRGQWLTCDQALAEPLLSPTASSVFATLKARNEAFEQSPPKFEAHRDKMQAEAIGRVFGRVPERPSMDAMARKWLGHNLRGVRHLEKRTLDEILDAGSHAFKLRVADPYLPHQMQGIGFTWSFFTHKDAQDCHVHGAPIVEIYGILEGEVEVWSKPYYERGTAAWSHRILGAGDWLEVDSLQCHIVHWRTEGKGVVFKAGPGPLAEVGKLGVKGKTQCTECPCMKPPQVREMERRPEKADNSDRSVLPAEPVGTSVLKTIHSTGDLP
jgi:hypothetical protein